MKKVILYLATSASIFGVSGHLFADSPYFSLKDGDGFKRFSISAGWLHAAPQGSANPVNINTKVAEGTQSKVGDVSKQSVLSAAVKDSNPTIYGLINLLPGDTVPAALSGTATVNGLSGWTAQGTGLEADSVDTLGIMTNYHFTDHLSLEVKAGVPPKVNINGKGEISAPLSGKDEIPLLLGQSIDLKKDIHITNIAQSKKAASATAWLPAAELHYQFGKTGVNKFRPYVGVGVMYAHFTHLKLDDAIGNDLIAAGHMIQNVLDGKAGAALDGKTSSANPKIKVEADDAWAPIATLGATYDFNPNWFAVGSVSYAPMSSDAKITISDSNTGKQLISAKTKIDIDPLITYVGVGYRF
ncbi:OmpW/AlkL family protein [Acinetobacter gerneri]|uniref:OmpW/AlkL family protein n=1 Tax=Acinetobacter gerneri TaxID=202952 RepID=UPI003A8AFF1D